MTSQNSLGKRCSGRLLRGRLEQPPLGLERAWNIGCCTWRKRRACLGSGRGGIRAPPCVSAACGHPSHRAVCLYLASIVGCRDASVHTQSLFSVCSSEGVAL